MTQRSRVAILTTVFTGFLGASAALADVYTWTDANGRVNVSNLPPPQGTRVTNVVHENPPTPEQIEARRDAARMAEVQALTDRVRQLEHEAESAARRSAMPPPIAYAPPMGAPQIVNIAIEQAPQPQPASYVAPAPVAAPWNMNPWCDPVWISCNAWLGPQLYPALPVVVVRTGGGFKRSPPAHGGRPVVNPKPVNPPPNPRKR